MKLETFIQQNYGKLQNLSKKITRGHQNSDDLLNDVLLNILERGKHIEEDKWLNFISTSIKTQYNSKTSPFYYIYKNPYGTRSLDSEDIIEEEPEPKVDEEKMGKDIGMYIASLDIYQKTVAQRHFIEGVSQRELSRHYNINRIHIHRTITGIKQKVYQNFNKKDYR
jgi:RNA polymerase sigma factor (sigma-70 family)